MSHWRWEAFMSGFRRPWLLLAALWPGKPRGKARQALYEEALWLLDRANELLDHASANIRRRLAENGTTTNKASQIDGAGKENSHPGGQL